MPRNTPVPLAAAVAAALGSWACASATPGGTPATAPTGPGTEVTATSAGSRDDAIATARYVVYVANESSDVVSKVEFSPESGARVRAEIPVGLMPGDIEGAHGLQASPDGRYWYLSIAHGQPFGTVWKFDARADTLVGRTEVGMFPATMGITPDGAYLFVVNFNLHGDPVASTVSVIHTETMTQLAQTPACVRPHGSRVGPEGRRVYIACVGGDQLLALDAGSFEVVERFSVAPGAEGLLSDEEAGRVASACGPTWATPGVGTRAGFVYVPCNRASEVLEIDARAWTVTRRFSTGAGPYNLDISPDGRTLVATLKGAQEVAVFDLESGTETARLPTTASVTHGVVVSADGRFAFVTNEAVGATPGTLDIFDLAALRRVGGIELGLQAGGIALVRSE